jgi:hypothetical protein
MPNATVRATARTLPENLNRRAVLGSVLAAGALVATPFPVAAANLGVEPELRALIAAWHESHRRLEETYDASCAADERAWCPPPKALIATESDTQFWSNAVPGRLYLETDVTRLRALRALACRLDDVFSCSGYDDRVAEIIVSWDNWQEEQKAAKERAGVAEAEAVWSQAVADYHATGNLLAKLQAKTMAGVIAKLLAAASNVTEDDLEDGNNSYAAVLAGAALDAQALYRGEEARS